MADRITAKKSPIFIRISTQENSIICINPNQLVSFHIEQQAECYHIKEGADPKSRDLADYDKHLADVLRLYFVGGTTLRYEVGKDITADEFGFAVNLLSDWIYRSDAELTALAEAHDKAKLELWNKTADERV
jgi:hypothetical protein